MIISSLSTTPYSTICETFIKAFSDYQIPINITLQKLKQENLQKGIDLNSSFGAFDNDKKLIGFILCGKRKNGDKFDYYNGSTGVIPSERGRHVGKQLLEAAVNNALSNSANSFCLEVLCDNVKAQKLYSSNGFYTTRNLFCYQKSIDSIKNFDNTLYSIHTPKLSEFEIVSSKISLNFEPSWQNSSFAISNIYNSLETKVLCKEDKEIGFVVLNSQTGQILQIAAKDDSLEIIESLLSLSKSLTKAKKLRFINIDSNSPLSSFLEQNEWNLFVKQYEMGLKLN